MKFITGRVIFSLAALVMPFSKAELKLLCGEGIFTAVCKSLKWLTRIVQVYTDLLVQASPDQLEGHLWSSP